MSASLLFNCCPAMLTIPVCCAFRPHCDQNGWALPRSLSSNTLTAMRNRIEGADRRFMAPPGCIREQAEEANILAHSPRKNIKIAALGPNGGLSKGICSEYRAESTTDCAAALARGAEPRYGYRE